MPLGVTITLYYTSISPHYYSPRGTLGVVKSLSTPPNMAYFGLKRPLLAHICPFWALNGLFLAIFVANAQILL